MVETVYTRNVETCQTEIAMLSSPESAESAKKHPVLPKKPTCNCREVEETVLIKSASFQCLFGTRFIALAIITRMNFRGIRPNEEMEEVEKNASISNVFLHFSRLIACSVITESSSILTFGLCATKK